MKRYGYHRTSTKEQHLDRGIDDKESGYDDSQERRELERTAEKLFG